MNAIDRADRIADAHASELVRVDPNLFLCVPKAGSWGWTILQLWNTTVEFQWDRRLGRPVARVYTPRAEIPVDDPAGVQILADVFRRKLPAEEESP